MPPKAAKTAAKPKPGAKQATKKDPKKPVQKPMKRKYRKIRTCVHFHRPYTLRKAGEKKYAKSCGGTESKKQKMDQFHILKFPLTTESAMKKIEDNNTLVFIVDLRCNKKQIKHAVKKMYDIKASKVNTLIRPDGLKKAYVKLQPDYDALDIANKIGIL
jgi:large subunit ribosomal protein L23Ae|mmetsp:Transcript_35006/g.58664  ORF Transcript_35006/g.58664 Transcript_35006/m.58664 type:complete len:159 (+) Transcript_35006:47-523(+)